MTNKELYAKTLTKQQRHNRPTFQEFGSGASNHGVTMQEISFSTRKLAREWSTCFWRSYNQPDIPMIRRDADCWTIEIPAFAQSYAVWFFDGVECTRKAVSNT